MERSFFKKKKIALEINPKKQKDPFELKDPFDDGSSSQFRRTCLECGSNLGEKDFVCPNCGSNQQSVSDAHNHTPDKPGKQFNPYSNDPHSNPIQVQRGVPINRAASVQKESTVEDKKEKTKKDSDIVPHVSDDFKRKKNHNVDEQMDEITKSCLDLAIDG